MDAANALNEFVQKDYSGIQNRRAKTKENAKNVVSAPSRVGDANDQGKTQGGHEKAQKLLFAEPFLKKDGTNQGNDDRGEIIA